MKDGKQVASDRQQATVCKPKNGRVKSEMRLATWNVRTLHQPGKLHNMDREMRRLKVDIMGVAEVRWTGVGSVELPEGGCFIYSGGQEHKHGVGVMLNKRAKECLSGFYAVSERVEIFKFIEFSLSIATLHMYNKITTIISIYLIFW